MGGAGFDVPCTMFFPTGCEHAIHYRPGGPAVHAMLNSEYRVPCLTIARAVNRAIDREGGRTHAQSRFWSTRL